MSLPRKVFLIGIGGTAMGNLAVCLKRSGIDVFGSDSALYPPISDLLEKNDIVVCSPDDLSAMTSSDDTLFIVGNAVSRGHPQVEWLMSHPEMARCSFPEFLGDHLLRRSQNLVVAGTHGKSTTTAVAATMLKQGPDSAGWFVGGVLADNSPAFEWAPENRFFAIEGDEYDSAFFDKRSKFVHYRPKVLLLNNLEFDHADIFRDTQDVQRSFRQVISLVPGDGSILYNGDDPRLKEILPVPWTRCLSFGFGGSNDFIISREVSSPTSMIRIRERDTGGIVFQIQSRLMGEFNARNLAGAALGVRFLSGGQFSSEVDISSFAGLKRRQEIRFADDRHILVEDFGHHPTALQSALQALRETYPGWRIHAMVEPRSNTMRTNRLQGELETALSGADAVTIAPIHRKDGLPAEDRLDTDRLSAAMESKSIDCTICREEGDLLEAFQLRLQEGPVLTVVFSNGAFGGLLGEFERILRQ